MNAKVQINKQDRSIEPQSETASQQLTRSAGGAVHTTDARGRIIVLKKPGAIAKLRFFEAMGEAAASRMWMTAVMPLMNVISIDGVSNSVPINKNEIEALYQRLDEDGMEAAYKGLDELLKEGADQVDVEAAKK